MIVALKIIIVIFSVFAALSLLCAVRIGRRATPPADPFSRPFGEVPALTPEQIDRIRPRDFSHDPLRRSFATRNHSAGVALRPDAGSGGPLNPLGQSRCPPFSGETLSRERR